MSEALLGASLTAQAAALARGALSARELAVAMIDAASRRVELNAFIALDAERVLLEAEASDRHRARHGARPLEGLLIGIKDNIDVRAERSNAGMAARRGVPPAIEDAASVARLRAAGAIPFGRLNMDEAALGALGDNPHFGRCVNPHRPGYSAGGSSSGSGAAVAAGLCSAALGTDSMGSVRIPASYCGVVGFKPSFGAISPRGLVRVSRRLDHVGLLTRTAADLPPLFQALQGLDPHSAQSRTLAPAASSSGALRLGVPALDGIEVDAQVRDGFAAALADIQRLGHSLQALPASEISPGAARRAGLLVCEAEMLVEHGAAWRDQREHFSPLLTRLLEHAAGRSAADYAAADRLLDAAQVQLQRWLAQCDVLLWPTTPQTAFPCDAGAPNNQADLTCLANMAGTPALSLPLPRTRGDLPIGLQLIGALGSDTILMALAQGLAQHWEEGR